MANKKNGTISATNIDKYLKTLTAAERVEFPYGDDGVLELEIKRVVDPSTFATMVNRAANTVFVENEETGEMEYMPAFEPVAKAEAVLAYVANFGDSLTTARAGELMYSPVMDSIRNIWKEKQQYDFDCAFYEEVEHRCKMILSAERYRLNMISEQLDRAMNALTAMTSMFEGVDNADMQAAIKKLGAMDDNALVEAVIAANKEKK